MSQDRVIAAASGRQVHYLRIEKATRVLKLIASGLAVMLLGACSTDDEEALGCVYADRGQGWSQVSEDLGLSPSDWEHVRSHNLEAASGSDPTWLSEGALVCAPDHSHTVGADLSAATEGQADGGTGGRAVEDLESPDGSGSSSGGGAGGGTEPPAELMVSDLVPVALLDTRRVALDPSLERAYSDPYVELVWEIVSKWWRVTGVINVVDRTVQCIYEMDAGSIGIYGELDAPRALAVGVILPGRAASVDVVVCVARELLPPTFAPDESAAEPIQECAAYYEVETTTGRALVGFAAAGSFDATGDLCQQICNELPGCDPAVLQAI